MPPGTESSIAVGTPCASVEALTARPTPSPPRTWLKVVLLPARSRVPLSCSPPPTNPCAAAGQVSGAQTTLYARCVTSPSLRALVKVTSAALAESALAETKRPPSEPAYKVPSAPAAKACRSAWTYGRWMFRFSELFGSQSESTDQVRPASRERIKESCPPTSTVSGFCGSTSSAWLYQAWPLRTSSVG